MTHDDLKIGDKIIFLKEMDSSPPESIGIITYIKSDSYIQGSLWINYINPDRSLKKRDRHHKIGGFRSLPSGGDPDFGYIIGDYYNYFTDPGDYVEVKSEVIPECLINTKLNKFLIK